METGEYFLVIVVLLLAISVSSAQLSSTNYNISAAAVTDGGAGTGSTNYNSSAVVGVISGDMNSTSYINQLGLYYGLNVAPDDPIVSMNTSTGNNYTVDDLKCNANVNDNDGGTFTVETIWYLDGGLNLSINYSSVSNGPFTSTLDSGNTTKHDDWSCGMRLYDGEAYSAWGYSANTTIENSLPNITLTGPADGSNTTNRTPEFSWTSSDDDDDVLRYEINLTAYGSAQDDRWNDSLNDMYYVPSTDLQMLYDNGYYYIWKVRAYDGDANGPWSSEWNLSIMSAVSIKLTSNNMYFGNLGAGDSNNTDDWFNPFEIENDGNVYVNVSVNATPLWDNQQTSSYHYQFKADNSTEPGSFSWIGSLMSWTDMSFTGFVVGVNNLSYKDASDLVEIDINITVPAAEVPGVKNSTIVFKATLAE